jgi:sigma-B regulation protein RsbU (phosphoserine phosphatase)
LDRRKYETKLIGEGVWLTANFKIRRKIRMSTVRDRDLRSWILDRRKRLETAIGEFEETEHLISLLQEVDSALERMDKGSYGLCEVCHEPIEKERLISDPLVQTCLDHLTPNQQRALEQDLDLASRIQLQLLPKQSLSLAGWEVYYHYDAAGPVSGDYCDIVSPKPESENLFFLLGDVSGKGVAASMLMANLHAIFHSLIPGGMMLNQLVERANRIFCESTMSTAYATLVCGKTSRSGEVYICNAGHCPPILIQGDEITKLEATGLPIGIFSTERYSVKRMQLSLGDTLLLYTDGLTEAQDRGGAEYGEERLVRLIKKSRNFLPRALTEACLEDLKMFLSEALKTDDLTIMVIRRTV